MGFAWHATPSFPALSHAGGKGTAASSLILSCEQSPPKVLVRERQYRTYVAWGQSEALPQEDSIELPFEELRDQRFIIGSPDDCVEQLLRYHERLGAKHYLLRVPWASMPQVEVLEAVELFGERVIPRLRDV